MKQKLLPLLAVCLLLCLGGVFYLLSRPKPTLTVYSQGDYIDPRVLRSFTRSTGIEVEYCQLDSNSGEIRPADCDLLLADIELLACMERQSQLVPIDRVQVSDWAQFSPAYLEQTADLTGGCAVPCLWATMGLLFDPTHTDTRVTGWDALFDREFSGQVAMTARYRDAFTLALAAENRPIDSVRPEDVLAAHALLSEQAPAGYYFESELAPIFRSNTAVLAPCCAREAVALMEEMPELTFVIPPEGSWRTMLAYAIPARSRQQQDAYTLLDYLCQPSSLAKNAVYSGWSTPSAAAYALMDSRWQGNPLLYPCGSHMSGDLLPETRIRGFQAACPLNWPPKANR